MHGVKFPLLVLEIFSEGYTVKISSLFLLGAAVVYLAAPAHAASFSCDKASTPLETAICADAELSRLDEELTAAYHAVREQLSAGGAAAVQADQREWLAWLRDRCAGGPQNIGTCLKHEYTVRRDLLQQGTVHSGGMLFFPRLKVFFVPAKAVPERDLAAIDPGFGVGRFSWPQIDHPTPQQAQWNAAVRAQAARLSGGDSSDFVADAYSEDSLGYTIEAASETLISVRLSHDFYYYGAAHSNADSLTFNWLPLEERTLQAQDFFRPDSGWKALMAKRSAQEALEQLSRHNMAPYAFAEQKSTLRSVEDPAHWVPGPQQLTIVFPEYALTPRALGELSVSFSWNELKPYLAAGFDPASLPETAPASPASGRL